MTDEEAIKHIVDRKREERLAKMQEQLKRFGVSEDDLDFGELVDVMDSDEDRE